MVELKSRERVMRALNHQEADRVPIDIGGMSNLTTLHRNSYKKLQKHFGQNDEMIITSSLSQSVLPGEWVRKRFKADCYPLYITGPTKEQLNPHVDPDGARWYMDEWGVKWKCPAGGLYFDPVEPPLQDCELEDLEKYNWPDPNDKSKILGLRDKAKELYENTDYALVMGGPLYGGIYVPCQYLLGYEEFFIKLLTEPEVVQPIIDKIVEYHIGQWNLILDEVGKYIQVVVLGDDLGTQNAPIMSPKIYREMIKPAQKKVVDFIKSKADVKIVYHCDGAIREFLPDFVDIGFDAWNPIQVSANGMDDTAYLKQKIGKDICFWGGSCDSQTVLSVKTPGEVREEVRKRVNDLAPGGGLILSSIHNIQQDVPVENIVALYDAFYEFGSKIYK